MTRTTRLLTLAAAAGLAVTAAEARDLRVAPGAPPAHPASSHLYSGLDLPAGGIRRPDDRHDPGPRSGEPRPDEGRAADRTCRRGQPSAALLPRGTAELRACGRAFAVGDRSPCDGRGPDRIHGELRKLPAGDGDLRRRLSRLGLVRSLCPAHQPPVETAADVAGLRLRSGGAPFSRWAENFGAVPVSIGVGETFEAMSQGTIDGSMASVGDLLSFRLVELTRDVTAVPLGTYFSTSNFATAQATWADMSEEERGALLRAANRANADFTNRWGYEFPEIARQAAEEAGITLTEADPAFAEAAEAFSVADRETAAQISAERFGMSDASERSSSSSPSSRSGMRSRPRSTTTPSRWPSASGTRSGARWTCRPTGCDLEGPAGARRPRRPARRGGVMRYLEDAWRSRCKGARARRLDRRAGASGARRADVATRNLCRRPIPATNEIVSRYYMVLIAFLPLAWVERRAAWSRWSCSTAMLSPRARRISDALVALLRHRDLRRHRLHDLGHRHPKLPHRKLRDRAGASWCRSGPPTSCRPSGFAPRRLVTRFGAASPLGRDGRDDTG
jgi:TRAP-type transport system periplasmic protein